jgi:crotonobetainyl-CoA:carnitine CoA-transferase CaiB-like acyl-CoA transferase
VVAPWAAKLSKSQAADILKQYRVPAAPVRDLVEVTADAHMHARGMLHDIEHPDMGSIVLPTSPLRFSGSPPPEIRPEPKMGEHVREILAQWLEMDAREIRELKDDGVFG